MKLSVSYYLLFFALKDIQLVKASNRLLGCPGMIGKHNFKSMSLEQCQPDCIRHCAKKVKAVRLKEDTLVCYETDRRADGRLYQPKKDRGRKLCHCGIFEGENINRRCYPDIRPGPDYDDSQWECNFWCNDHVRILSYTLGSFRPIISLCLKDDDPLYGIAGGVTTGTCYKGQKDLKVSANVALQYYTYCHCGLPTTLPIEASNNNTRIIALDANQEYSLSQSHSKRTTRDDVMKAYRKDKEIKRDVTVLGCSDPWNSYSWGQMSSRRCWSLCHNMCAQRTAFGFFDENRSLICYEEKRDNAEYQFNTTLATCSCGMRFGSRKSWKECEPTLRFGTTNATFCKETCSQFNVLYHVFNHEYRIARCIPHNWPVPEVTTPLTGGCHRPFEGELDEILNSPRRCRCGLPLPEGMERDELDNQYLMDFEDDAKKFLDKPLSVDKMNEFYADNDGNAIPDMKSADFVGCEGGRFPMTLINVQTGIKRCTGLCKKTFGHLSGKLLCYERIGNAKSDYNEQRKKCQCSPNFADSESMHSTCYETLENVANRQNCSRMCSELRVLEIVDQNDYAPMVMGCVNGTSSPVQKIPLGAYYFKSARISKKGLTTFKTFCQCGMIGKTSVISQKNDQTQNQISTHKRYASPSLTKGVAQRVTKIATLNSTAHSRGTESSRKATTSDSTNSHSIPANYTGKKQSTAGASSSSSNFFNGYLEKNTAPRSSSKSSSVSRGSGKLKKNSASSRKCGTAAASKATASVSSANADTLKNLMEGTEDFRRFDELQLSENNVRM